MADSKVFVDEFDSEERLGGMEWCSFLDADMGMSALCKEIQRKAIPTNHA